MHAHSLMFYSCDKTTSWWHQNYSLASTITFLSHRASSRLYWLWCHCTQGYHAHCVCAQATTKMNRHCYDGWSINSPNCIHMMTTSNGNGCSSSVLYEHNVQILSLHISLLGNNWSMVMVIGMIEKWQRKSICVMSWGLYNNHCCCCRDDNCCCNVEMMVACFSTSSINRCMRTLYSSCVCFDSYNCCCRSWIISCCGSCCCGGGGGTDTGADGIGCSYMYDTQHSTWWMMDWIEIWHRTCLQLYCSIMGSPLMSITFMDVEVVFIIACCIYKLSMMKRIKNAEKKRRNKRGNSTSEIMPICTPQQSLISKANILLRGLIHKKWCRRHGSVALKVTHERHGSRADCNTRRYGIIHHHLMDDLLHTFLYMVKGPQVN